MYGLAGACVCTADTAQSTQKDWRNRLGQGGRHRLGPTWSEAKGRTREGVRPRAGMKGPYPSPGPLSRATDRERSDTPQAGCDGGTPEA